jgi:uncharacterized protein YeaO (DUF488 family)
VTEFRVKRVYDDPSADDGKRVLVDRLWPRGMTKERAALDLWAKEIAPSTALRTWFHANPDQFPEFTKRYLAEVKDNPTAVADLKKLDGTVTLLYSVRDAEHNHAQILADYLKS